MKDTRKSNNVVDGRPFKSSFLNGSYTSSVVQDVIKPDDGLIMLSYLGGSIGIMFIVMAIVMIAHNLSLKFKN